MLKRIGLIILLFPFLCISILAQQQSGAADVTKAIAVLQPISGSNVHGTVTFTKEPDGIQMTADIEGLTEGKHGFHIHEFGDISSADGKSAGGHFNPANVRHAGPGDAMHHAGDMGNITAGSDGKAHLEIKLDNADFTGPNSIIGRSVVVHEKEDDLMSQPAGNSGARVAVGVIGIAAK